MARRNLTTGEIDLGYSVYGESIDFSTVQIHDRAFLGVANTVVSPDGNIYYPRDDARYVNDLSLGTLGQRATFIHELGHVWQHQQGINVVTRRGLNGDYVFIDKVSAGIPFGKWGIEEQAAYFEDLYRAAIGIRNTRSRLS